MLYTFVINAGQTFNCEVVICCFRLSVKAATAETWPSLRLLRSSGAVSRLEAERAKFHSLHCSLSAAAGIQHNNGDSQS